MANVHVDYAEVGSAAARLTHGQGEVEALLRQLKTVIDQLVSTGFVTDRASGRFGESYTRWNAGATQLLAGLAGMSQYLHKAITEHQHLDAQLSQGAG